MKNSAKKIIDLKRRRESKPLIVRRSERMHRNLLKLEKTKPYHRGNASMVSSDLPIGRLARKFELTKKQRAEPKIFLTGQKIPPTKLKRFKIIIGALVFVVILNLAGVFGSGKSKVENVVSTAFSGLGSLVEAGNSLASGNFDQSAEYFSSATEALISAEREILTLGGAGAVLSTQPDSVQSGSRLVTAGKLIASAGEKFAMAASEVNLIIPTWQIRQQAISQGEKVNSFTEELKRAIKNIINGITELEDASAILQLVDPESLPESLSEKVRNARNQLDLFLKTATPISNALPQLTNLLGDTVPRKYLILFQNTAEIRPTGGFIGSIGVLTLNDGFVSKFEIKDVYEVDGLIEKKLKPPEGFGFITNNWGLRDANYHPDFPTSAEAAAWLYEESGQGTVDGVIAITSDLLTEIVESLDGVKLPRFEKKISAEDLTLLLSLIIETKTDGAAAPKKILEELWEVLKNNLTEIPQKKLIGTALESLENKDIQFWSENTELQSIAEALKIDNSLKKTEGDYLFIVNTSISGNKSDLHTHNQVTHETDIDEDGTAINTLTIKRSHNWNEAAEQKLVDLADKFGIDLDEQMKEILGRGRNIDLIKVFVPLGSKLIQTEEIALDRIETKDSAGKTYFMFTLTTQPGKSKTVKLSYKLAQKFDENYSFLAERQAGDKVEELEKNVVWANQKIFEGELRMDLELGVNSPTF